MPNVTPLTGQGLDQAKTTTLEKNRNYMRLFYAFHLVINNGSYSQSVWDSIGRWGDSDLGGDPHALDWWNAGLLSKKYKGPWLDKTTVQTWMNKNIEHGYVFVNGLMYTNKGTVVKFWEWPIGSVDGSENWVKPKVLEQTNTLDDTVDINDLPGDTIDSNIGNGVGTDTPNINNGNTIPGTETTGTTTVTQNIPLLEILLGGIVDAFVKLFNGIFGKDNT